MTNRYFCGMAASKRLQRLTCVSSFLLLLLLVLLLQSSEVRCEPQGDQDWPSLPDGSEMGLDGGWQGQEDSAADMTSDPDYQPADESGYGDSAADMTSDPDYQPADDSGYGDSAADMTSDPDYQPADDSGYGDSGYGYEESSDQYDGGSYGYEDSGYGYDDSDYGYDDSDYGYDDSGYGYDDSGYGYDDSGYGYDDGGFGYDDSYDDIYDDSSYGYGDSYDDSSYGYGDSYDDSGYDYDSSDYGYDEDGLDDFGSSDYGSFGRRRSAQVRTRSLSADSEESEAPEAAPEVEFEDASADAEEIPSGYFGQQEPQQERRRGRGGGGRFRPAAFDDASPASGIDLPGFRLAFGAATEWWKYDRHVCLAKETHQQPVDDERIDPDMSVYSVRCSEVSTTEYTCNITQWNSRVVKSEILSYTCCPGYARLHGDRGCPRTVDSQARNVTFASLLRRHGYSEKLVDLLSAVLANDTSQKWTVFVPARAALEEALGRVNISGSAAAPEWFVRTMLNHFAQPAQYTQAMRSGQRLPTLEKSGGVFVTKTAAGRVLANCAPVVRANQPFGGHSLAHFTSAVLTVQQSNLYEMMLKKLEASGSVSSADEAEKLLAPLKPTLTRPKPMTVFMHLPTREEIDSGCYAKNLRSAIVNGAECNASLTCGGHLRTVDGQPLSVRATISGSRILLGNNRLLASADHLATNGVLHMVNATESMIGFSNDLTRRLKTSDGPFKRLLHSSEPISAALLLPPRSWVEEANDSNSSTAWLANASALTAFARRHALANASALRGSVRLAMLDGVRRDFVQLAVRGSRRSLFGDWGVSRRRQFVDCVPVERTAVDCTGVAYFLMQKELPDFAAAPSVLDYLSSGSSGGGSGVDDFSAARRIVQFATGEQQQQKNATTTGGGGGGGRLAERLRDSDVALVLLADADMHRLTGGLLSRRREPTRQQWQQLADWFAKYLVAAKPLCAVRSINSLVTLPVFRANRRPCRSLACTFRRRFSRGQWQRVLVRRGRHVTVKEGFLLPGSLL